MVTETRDFSPEFVFVASRSSGPGGQNVNKVSTKIELRFDVVNSRLLREGERETLFLKLGRKISGDGVLIIIAQSERTQLKNRDKAIEKFYSLIERALKPEKKRITTLPSISSIEKRLEKKRLVAEKKTLRKSIPQK
jgi:ribosome-associated protein